MLAAQSSDNFAGSHLRFFDFLLSMALHLNASAIASTFTFYRARQLVSPGRADWLVRLQKVLEVFFPTTPILVMRDTLKGGRRAAIQMLQDAYNAAHGYSDHVGNIIEQLLLPLCERALPNEKDVTIAASILSMMEGCLMDSFMVDCEQNESSAIRLDCILVSLMRLSRHHPQTQITDPPIPPAAHAKGYTAGRSPDRSSSRPVQISLPVDTGLCAAQSLISLFFECIVAANHACAELAVRIFRHLLELSFPLPLDKVKSAKAPTKTRLAVLQFLTRLRADQRHRIWCRQIVDFEALAASIDRLTISESDTHMEQFQASSTAPPNTQERPRGRRMHRKEHVSDSSQSPPSSISRRRIGSRSRTRTQAAANSPARRSSSRSESLQALLWLYPDKLLYPFPSRPVRGTGSSGLVSFDHVRMRDWSEAIAESDESYTALATPLDEPSLVVLPVSEYLEVLIACLQTETDWEIVSYVLCAVPSQLANKHFACGPECAVQLQVLRRCLCDQLSKDSLGSHVHLPPSVRRSDMHALAYQWLATLIAYRDLYNRDSQNEMVLTFTRGLSKTPNIAKPSIHALSMACYEFESSMSKYLPEILGALVRIMSTVNMPVHILELVASIGHIKSLYVNFTEDDYKKVFALAVQYLSSHYEGLVDDPSSAVVPEDLSRAIVHAFKQYVFLLSFYVITLWYTVVPTSERPRYTSFIVQRLLRANDGEGAIDAATEVSLDMLARLAYSSSSLSSADMRKARQPSQTTFNRSWLAGHSVLSIEGSEGDGKAEVIIRRPSGVTKQVVPLSDNPSKINILQLLHDHRNRFQITPSVQLDLPSHNEAPIFDADAAFFTLFLPPHSHINDHGHPHPIAENDHARRAISVLDSMPHIDFHKIGIVYIGPNQRNEQEILCNIHGSRSYSTFLAGLGTLTRLQGYENNTGGLDRELDIDGKWTYLWSDGIQQMIFHVATLMPTRVQRDPDCNGKKRHIGNDYVKILFNESGSRTPLDIIPGQFNFVNIIIEPHTPAGEAWKGASGISNNTEFFRVSMQQRPEMPEIGPLGIFKMISTASLPKMVRELALHANVFAQLFLQSVGVEGRSAGRQRLEYSSTWRNRLRE